MFTRIDGRTVIDGIETAAQAKLVRQYGVDVIQGLHYARPVNGAVFIGFLQKEYRKVPISNILLGGRSNEAKNTDC